MSVTGMKHLSCLGYVPGFTFLDMSICEHCLYGRQTILSHKSSNYHKKERLQLVHSDVCGPKVVMSMGAMYFVIIIDDFLQKVWPYPLKRKDQVLEVFQRFVTLVKMHIGKKNKFLHLNNGGEHVSKAFQDFCDARGIRREFTAPYIPSSNGVSERMNRII